MAVSKKKSSPKKTKAVGRPTKDNGVNVKEALIQAGVELLENTSLEDISLRKVAAHAGVSHVACYHHFENKHALFSAIAEIGFQKYFETYQKELEKTDQDFKGRYRALGWTYFQFIMTNRQFARIMFGGTGVDAKTHPTLLAVSRRTYRQLHEIIRMGQNLGHLEKGNTREKTLASWAMIHGIAMLFLEGRLQMKNDIQEMEKFIQTVTEYAFIGMKSK
ncbi:TetR/AcrR family transcriptional regulator [Leptospira bandrabouensis]|uniref:TetR/AcrR family transcriptional regulator n=1 Tax=Leptospira bandrabouensis TaxID=2484903 RepID=UPI001EE7DE95|nr:TetR/AcrR family transcriptional regulator [Leptospira bandrabouensis]MCG6145619.1 TetR/AcrR family transcriptional regulator [Leptospira bandrabouensis]MCG6153356.1 TetR/AcrR family transcriptional regulator [Leptospira bandrabouensis]MCG6160840.1 TetR/AcrR family transcriptional regulator [Leptospira bandrabouensis]MCG6165379.1 TetR/AcrR family transcriptional regulator [Leptospira bandrabouensis]MCW7459522.1 TetR/AcrR family transcriptional regulator [Leptospira bandrabouensis]